MLSKGQRCLNGSVSVIFVGGVGVVEQLRNKLKRRRGCMLRELLRKKRRDAGAGG